jgi:hypothetical protein
MKGARRKDAENISKQEKHDAEISRAIAAIKLEMARDDPLVASLKRALGVYTSFTLPYLA